MWGDNGGRGSRGTRGTGGEERPGAIYAEHIALRDIWDMSPKIQVLKYSALGRDTCTQPQITQGPVNW